MLVKFTDVCVPIDIPYQDEITCAAVTDVGVNR